MIHRTGTAAEISRLLSLAALFFMAVPGSFAQSLDAATLKRIRAATFEVVIRKPTIDSLTYERPLPLEKLPYAQRTDPYVAIGTAFAIAENRYVTAAHVLSPGSKSQFGEPALRDASGAVHAIAQIHKYSNAQDFIELSLEDELHIQPLEVNLEPELSEPVFAVGNALGEGIVIRDGLLTSRTPEDRHGEWKWLRFSAAASPGNSGGPLLDKSGKAIGVVLMKSANENLNYAAPIELVLHAPTDVARLRFEAAFSVPIMDAVETREELVELPLPNTFARVAEAEAQRVRDFDARGRTELLSKHGGSIFPEGAGSEMLLASPPRTVNGLGLMCRQVDGTWNVFVPQNVQTAQLGDNGWIAHGQLLNVTFAKFHRPDSVSPDVFYNDSKYYADALLKAFDWKRYVGTEAVKIVSAGKAHTETQLVDRSGRVWQVRLWNVEYDDNVLISVALPVPDGYLAMLHYTKTAFASASQHDVELMASFAFPTYTGTLEQWHDYFERPALLPAAFADATLGKDLSQGLRFNSKQLSLEISADFQKVRPESVLSLRMSHLRSGSSVMWGVSGIALAEKDASGKVLLVERYGKPVPSLPEPFALQWQKLRDGLYPFNAVLSEMNGVSVIASRHPFPAPAAGFPNEPDSIYTVAIMAPGKHSEEDMAAALTKLSSGLSIKQ